jgi:hypothetical protein
MTSTHHHQLPGFFCTSNFQTACMSVLYYVNLEQLYLKDMLAFVVYLKL